MSKTYMVKGIFGPTIQGEGPSVGGSAVFLRFAGCNMWDGRSETKPSSICYYCDTDFRGGTKMTAQEILDAIEAIETESSLLVVTGGEPALQWDSVLSKTLCDCGWWIQMETNGSTPLKGSVHELIISPKVNCTLVENNFVGTSVFALKLLYPWIGPGFHIEDWLNFDADHKFIQPIANPDGTYNVDVVAGAVDIISQYPSWRISVQIQKFLGVE